MHLRLMLLTAALAAAAPAGAKTLYVANDGLDGPGCGTRSAPCRSIMAGIAAASAGDTVSVGPGRYGDLDRDGLLGEPGEEAGADGVVDVTKAVRVLSASGASATTIDGIDEIAVSISGATGVVFGARNKGFTVRTTGLHGIQVAGGASGTTVAGNVVLRALTGIHVDAADVEVTDNHVYENDTGIAAFGAECLIARNAVADNVGSGMRIEGIGCVLDGNVVVGNQVGLFTDSSGLVIRRSTFAGNHLLGASLVGSGHTIEQSSFYGNGDLGGMQANCALESEQPLLATGNYWGSPLGPGHDPADLICTLNVTFEPFAKKGKTPKLRPSR
jgi:hypothetical protein